MVKIPDYIPFSKKERRRRFLTKKKVIFVGILLLIGYCATRPKHLGRVDKDTSRVESITFSTPCGALLGEGAERIQVELLSVEPKKTRAGLTAILDVKICNPTENEIEIPGVDFRYVPGIRGAPGFTWELGQKRIGSGFCDEYSIESPPLGELITFKANQGRIEVRGPTTTTAVLFLPGCCTPTPRSTPSPTPVRPTQTPTAPPTPTPIPPCDDDIFDSQAHNNDENTAARLTDGLWKLRLCPKKEFSGKSYSDVDWFYFDYKQNRTNKLSLLIRVDPSSAHLVNKTHVKVNFYKKTLGDPLHTSYKFDKTLTVTKPGKAAVGYFHSDEWRSKPIRIFARVVLDKRLALLHQGVSYSIEIEGARATVPDIPTPRPTNTPKPTRTPTPTQTPVPWIINGNGTLTDQNTGLMWTAQSKTTLTFDQTQGYCGRLFHAGYSDWRVPTLKELISVHNPNRDKKTKIAEGFHLSRPFIWSSTPTKKRGGAWYFVYDGTVQSTDGTGGAGEAYANSCNKNQKRLHSALCVREP